MQQRVDCAVRRVLWMCSCCVAGKRRTRFRRIGPPTKATSTVLFDCDVDIRVGSGFLNYINGYVTKSSDCVDRPGRTDQITILAQGTKHNSRYKT